MHCVNELAVQSVPWTPLCIAGIQTNFFRQEQAGPLKQNDWGPRIQLKIELILTLLPIYSYLKSETLKICIPIYLPYKQYLNQLNEDLLAYNS